MLGPDARHSRRIELFDVATRRPVVVEAGGRRSCGRPAKDPPKSSQIGRRFIPERQKVGLATCQGECVVLPHCIILLYQNATGELGPAICWGSQLAFVSTETRPGSSSLELASTVPYSS